MKKSYYLFFFIPTISLLFFIYFIYFIYFIHHPVIANKKGIVFDVRPGISKRHLVQDLKEQKIISNSFLFALYVFPFRNNQIKAGEYIFPFESTPSSIWRQIQRGTGLLFHSFTIVPGWSMAQLRQALDENSDFIHSTKVLSDKALTKRLGGFLSPISSEGAFFPDTYNYTRGVSDLVILKSAYNLMQEKLNNAWENRDKSTPFENKYQALIAASLIEKEAKLESERKIIAGVIVNRLMHGMYLQFDPTVIYGMATDHPIKKIDLQNDTPFNTYLHKGLPPTPIAMPSWSSIDAALHPIEHKYYYFVAKGDGSHHFSETLHEHNQFIGNLYHKVYFFNSTLVKKYLYSNLKIFKLTPKVPIN